MVVEVWVFVGVGVFVDVGVFVNVAVGVGVSVGEDVTVWVADAVGAGGKVSVKVGDEIPVEVAGEVYDAVAGIVADGRSVAVEAGFDKPQARETRANMVTKISRLDLAGFCMDYQSRVTGFGNYNRGERLAIY